MPLLLAFLIGLLAGLRALSAPAATAWATRLGWLKLERPLSYIGSIPAVVILTLLACLELIADKLPSTPRRTAPLGLIARIVMGGLCGACIASGGEQSATAGTILGILGGVLGCFWGYKARTKLVQVLGVKDIAVALVEDLIAIGGSLLLVSRF